MHAQVSPSTRKDDEATGKAFHGLALYALFFLSGCPALLYQIVWQRALFAIYGINIQSVTMVVSAFMLGLGLGSLAGGRISERSGTPLLTIFGLVELGTAAFGAVSLSLFHAIARFTAGSPALETGAICFALLLVPTALMGSTLPILTAYLVRVSGNVGRSVASLYFVNTLGSAVACFAAALILMRSLGESGSVWLAAGMNAAVGTTALILSFRRRLSNSTDEESLGLRAVTEEAEPRGGGLSFEVAIPVAGVAGLVALGYEILWYRAFSVGLESRAPAFALLLGFYLAGIAFGSLLSAFLCRRMIGDASRGNLRNIGLFLVAANLAGYLVLPATAVLARHRIMLGLPLVSISAAFLGAAFPLISHGAVRADRHAGRGLSWLYMSNIVGSTLGSFLVGYVLMDVWTLRQIAMAITVVGLGLGAAVLADGERSFRARAVSLTACAVLAALVALSAGPLYNRMYERLQARSGFVPSYVYRDLIEDKSGVAAVTEDLIVYGGGVYDGRINTDLVHDTNLLFRPFSISYWHPAPHDVLVIGLSAGAWMQVIAQHPQVEKVTAVEIDPGYLQLIRKYPQVRGLLANPKVSISIDDGRRWLVRNRDAKFDVIVSNTTWNWRAHATNLLSREFLELVRRHLKPGGVFFYNLTGSKEAELTGITVFPYAVRIGSCLAVSDSPLQLDIERWKRVIAAYRLDGVPVLDLANPEHQRRFDELTRLYTGSPQQDTLRRANRATRIVTDDNMGTEWSGIRLLMRF